MKCPSDVEAESFLRAQGVREETVAHCLRVAAIAGRLARNAAAEGHPVDERLARLGGLLHDCGLGRSHRTDHMIWSRELVLASDLGDAAFRAALGRIAERHVGPGLTREDVAAINRAEGIAIPERDYLPETLEEKIVCYAGLLTLGDREIPFEERWADTSQTYGAESAIGQRVAALHRQLGPWAGGAGQG